VRCGDELAAVDGKHAQQFEFDRGQVDLSAVAGHAPRCKVDCHWADAHDRFVGVIAAAAQDGADAGGELLGAEWLGDVVVGAGVERAHLLVFIAQGAEHDDREGAPPAHLTADVDAAAVWEDEVEDHDVGGANRDRVERLALGRRLSDLEARAAEHHVEPA
jgi:hypothetical protein